MFKQKLIKITESIRWEKSILKVDKIDDKKQRAADEKRKLANYADDESEQKIADENELLKKTICRRAVCWKRQFVEDNNLLKKTNCWRKQIVDFDFDVDVSDLIKLKFEISKWCSRILQHRKSMLLSFDKNWSLI